MSKFSSFVCLFSLVMSIFSISTTSAHADSAPVLEPISDVTVIGHRGASGYAPEHTLESYKKAIRLNADYVEFDLQMTKDRELVALHDTTLDRTTNIEEVYPERAPWAVRDFTLEEIKNLDAGSWFNETHPEYAKNKYEGLEVPTLQEALDVAKHYGKGDVGVYIETKAPDVYPGMEEKLVHTLQDNHMFEQGDVILQSFSADSLKKLNTMVPNDVPLIQLAGSVPEDESELHDKFDEISTYADGLGPNQKLVTPTFMEAAHSRGLIVHPYTVNKKENMKNLLDLGVDGMFTNFPDQLHDLLKTSQKENHRK
ncbi:glycerophosphodiester phosphodiesterase [Halobacillus sp. BBL2006]|uniref:glycerophosphodiester phosphodiesterase n=1 Tax=Halobacillus sp. BBL2006 TaxID=1543706 RepID=UPI000543ABDC|nr:glycerophosphodiester phosphodiesterase [Halobacillus sp. BBL2006]KHE72458.1 glycerophosphodiester phosphodiesterase [Halobacillus sp. BBL2006]